MYKFCDVAALKFVGRSLRARVRYWPWKGSHHTRVSLSHRFSFSSVLMRCFSSFADGRGGPNRQTLLHAQEYFLFNCCYTAAVYTHQTWRQVYTTTYVYSFCLPLYISLVFFLLWCLLASIAAAMEKNETIEANFPWSLKTFWFFPLFEG